MQFEESKTPSRFKAELEMNGRVFTHVFFAETLEQLSRQIMDQFPKAKILSIIGGGV